MLLSKVVFTSSLHLREMGGVYRDILVTIGVLLLGLVPLVLLLVGVLSLLWR